jgi:hypothetical protein
LPGRGFMELFLRLPARYRPLFIKQLLLDERTLGLDCTICIVQCGLLVSDRLPDALHLPSLCGKDSFPGDSSPLYGVMCKSRTEMAFSVKYFDRVGTHVVGLCTNLDFSSDGNIRQIIVPVAAGPLVNEGFIQYSLLGGEQQDIKITWVCAFGVAMSRPNSSGVSLCFL